MRARLRDDLKTALKARDRVAITALRAALAAIDNTESIPANDLLPSVSGNEHVAGSAIGVGAAEVERRHLTELDLRSILQEEVHQRSLAADEYAKLDRDDVAERLRSEADVLRRYLDIHAFPACLR